MGASNFPCSTTHGSCRRHSVRTEAASSRRASSFPRIQSRRRAATWLDCGTRRRERSCGNGPSATAIRTALFSRRPIGSSSCPPARPSSTKPPCASRSTPCEDKRKHAFPVRDRHRIAQIQQPPSQKLMKSIGPPCHAVGPSPTISRAGATFTAERAFPSNGRFERQEIAPH